MPRFVIIPADPSDSQTVICADAAGVLPFVERLGCRAADIELDGVHVFSIRLADCGLWSINRGSVRPRRTVGGRSELPSGGI